MKSVKGKRIACVSFRPEVEKKREKKDINDERVTTTRKQKEQTHDQVKRHL